ncbi:MULTISPECIES: hypothetical protein [unclassified Enterococcus]|uniref:hypothetical protein n=1 Tax=unclassified Enterococcus TaxID=2608891 RepID=UPI001A91C0FA|nr:MULTISPECIES: hypothetical protein [unclassified Enterococcus]MBO0462534.1 hypothetical protein [Enterococcus sp. DIV1298c]MBO1301145.1 hypothetical protein [Enterococcus sp. DIV1271a]
MVRNEGESGYTFIKGETSVGNIKHREEIVFVIEIVNPIEEDGEISTETVKFVSLNPLNKISRYIYERTILVMIDIFIDEVFFDRIYMTNDISRRNFEDKITGFINKRREIFK